eukprot:4134131-Alexandrium_andersonii.AAC.1
MAVLLSAGHPAVSLFRWSYSYLASQTDRSSASSWPRSRVRPAASSPCFRDRCRHSSMTKAGS